jgi:hypothetical protein
MPARVRLRHLGGLVGRVFCPAAARRRRLLPREWSVGAGRRYGDKHERCATRPAAGAVMGVAASGSGVAAGNAPLGQGHGARKGGAQGRPFCEMIYCRFPISFYHIKIVIILITICWKTDKTDKTASSRPSSQFVDIKSPRRVDLCPESAPLVHL